MTTTSSKPKKGAGAQAAAAAAQAMSVDEALKASAALYETLRGAQQRVGEIRSKLQQTEAGMRAAGRAEDYAKASELKTERDALKELSDQLTQRCADVRKELDAVRAVAARAYERERLGHELASNPVELTRAVVVDPVTDETVTVDYIDSADAIQVQLSGQSFDSEAYHLDSWAEEHNFLVFWKKGRVVFDA